MVGSGVGSDVGSGVGTAVGSGVGSGMGSVVGSGPGSAVVEGVGISLQLMVEGSRAVPALSRREPLGSHVKLREVTLARISDLTANDLPSHGGQA